MNNEMPVTLPGRARRQFLVILVVAAALAVAIGCFHFQYRKKEIGRQWGDQLLAVTDLNATRIGFWRSERIRDAMLLFRNPMFVRDARSSLENPQNKRTRRKLLSWINADRDKSIRGDILLVDADGTVLLSAGVGLRGGNVPPEPLEQALRTRRVTDSDLYLDSVTGKIFLDVVIPIMGEDGEHSIGAAVLRNDSERFLRPALHLLPASGVTLETLLLRREGNRLVYMNRRWPVLPGSIDLPATVATVGRHGVLEGTDYRGVPVIAAAKAVPGSRWMLMLKVDRSEVFAPRAGSAVLFLSGFSFIAVLVVLFWLFWVRQSRRLYESARAWKLLEYRYDLIFQNASDAILLLDDDLRIVQANRRALSAYGYTWEELRLLRLTALEADDHGAAAGKASGAIRQYGSEFFETVQVRKDGTTFPVEIGAQPFTVDGKNYYNCIIRDSTERKKAQEALRRSETKTRAIVNALPDMMFVLEKDGLIIDYAAEKSPDPFIPPGELRGKNIRDVLPLRQARQFLKQCALALGDGGGATFEFQLVKKDQLRDLEARAVAAGGGSVLCILRDITEHKWAEKAARERTELLQSKLDTLLSPGNGIGSVEAGQIIDIPELQELVRLYSRSATRIPMGILDLKDNVLVANRWQDVCAKFHRRQPEAAQNCFESNRALSREAGEGQFLEHKCKNNMRDIVTPIFVAGQHVADIFLGQFFYEDEEIDYGFFEKQAGQYGFDRQAYMEAVRQVPRLSRETVHETLAFYIKLAEMISRLSYRNVQLARSLVEQKRTEDALRQSEERFRALVETSSDLIWETDRRGVYTYISPRVKDLLGYDPDELLGKTFFDLMLPEEKKRVAALFRKTVRSRRPFGGIEKKNLHRDGRTVVLETGGMPILNAGGKLLGFRGVDRDVTVRRQMEDLLRQNREELKMILEHVSVPIFYKDKGSRIVAANNAFAAFLDVPLERLIGNGLDRFCPSDDVKRYEQADNEVMGTGTARMHIVETVKTRRGRRWVRVDKVPTRDASGAVTGVVGFMLDITDQKRFEEELREANDRLEEKVAQRTAELLSAENELSEARRLSDIGMLAATIAHEMRNPLAAINTAIYNIRRKAGEAPVGSHIATIEKKVLESDQIIGNLLNFSHIRMPDYSSVSPLEILDDCLSTVASKYPRTGIALAPHIDLSPESRIEADPVHLRMLFSNVLDNAFQALPGKTGEVRVEAALKKGKLEVTVTDNGVGIDEEDLQRICEPFFTRKSRGTGLGLAVCRQIVTLHSGDMSFESRKGKGTTVCITLPQKRRAARQVIGKVQRNRLDFNKNVLQ